MEERSAPVPVPHHPQATDYTCGPAALRMVLAAVLGFAMDEAELAHHLDTNHRIGTRQRAIANFVQHLGLDARIRHTDTKIQEVRDLMATGHVVLVCYWMPEEKTDHYAVVSRITADKVVLADPWHGPDTEMDLEHFDTHWLSDPALETRRDRWLVAIRVPGVED